MPESGGPWRAAWSAIYRRVRHRRAHERDLTHTIERFQSAAEAIPDGMVVLDANNRIKWANQRAQSLLGLDLAQDLGAPLVNLVRQPEFVRYIESGDYAGGIVIESQRDPGMTLAIQVVPFGIAEKLLIARDVTQIEAVARMRRDFIANVSHELKTPLTVISGFVETLQELELDERQRARFLPVDARAGGKHAAARRGSAHAVRARERAQSAGGGALRDRAVDARRVRRRQGAVQGQSRRLARHRRCRDHRRQPRGARERVRQPGLQCDPLHARERRDQARMAHRRRRVRACSR